MLVMPIWFKNATAFRGDFIGETVTFVGMEALAPYISNTCNRLTSRYFFWKSPAGKNPDPYGSSLCDWVTRSSPVNDEMKPNWYERGISSSLHLSATKEKTVFNSIPLSGSILKEPGRGGPFVLINIDDSADCPVAFSLHVSVNEKEERGFRALADNTSGTSIPLSWETTVELIAVSAFFARTRFT